MQQKQNKPITKKKKRQSIKQIKRTDKQTNGSQTNNQALKISRLKSEKRRQLLSRKTELVTKKKHEKELKWKLGGMTEELGFRQETKSNVLT